MLDFAPKTTRSLQLTKLLNPDAKDETEMLERTLSKLNGCRNLITTKISKISEGLIQDGQKIEKFVLLNKAERKMQELQKKEIFNYNLRKQLEDDEANVNQEHQEHIPLYKSLLPGWKSIDMDFLNLLPIREEEKKKKQKMLIADNNNKLSKEKERKIYPMCIEFFKKLNLIIFALTNEIAIHSIHHSGNKKVFNKVASHKFNPDFIPTCLEVSLHKQSEKLLVCVGVQSQKCNKLDQYDNHVLIYEFDQKNKFKVQEIASFKSHVPQITKILYRECGLIMACFMGYIELFDSIQFVSKNKWDNQINLNSNNFEETNTIKRTNMLDNIDEQLQTLLNQDRFSKKRTQSSFGGRQKQIDAINLNTGAISFKRENSAKPQLKKQRTKSSKLEFKTTKCLATISCLDYSSALDLIAFGGIQGKVGVIDSTTFLFKGMYNAQTSEISGLYFYDSQHLMFTIALDGEVAVWDASQMHIIQVVKNKQYMQANSINTSFFCTDTGTMLLATSKVFRWQMNEDPAIRIQIEQSNAIATDFLAQYKKGIQRCGVLRNSDQFVYQKTKKLQSEKINITNLLANEQQYIENIFTENHLVSLGSIVKNPEPKLNQNTLPSIKTELAGCFFDPMNMIVFTIDVNCLVRIWDCATGLCKKSYPLETFDDDLSQNKQKIQFCTTDAQILNLLVAFQGGVIQIYHIYSGSILFNKTKEETIDIKKEVSNVAFFSDQACFWFVATCWEGSVCFFSSPQISKGKEFITCKQVESYHRRDVTCVDVTIKNSLVTGSADNLICFWNTFNGQITKRIQIPAAIAPPVKGNTLCYIKFAEKTSNEQLLVFMSEGDVMCLDTISETFVQTKNQYNIAKIKSHSNIDIEDQHCFSVSEKGEGFYHKINVKTKQNNTKVSMEQVYSFCVNTKSLQQNELISGVKIHPEQNIVIISQINGVVHFKQLYPYEHLSYLNDPNYNIRFFNKFCQRQKTQNHVFDMMTLNPTSRNDKMSTKANTTMASAGPFSPSLFSPMQLLSPS